MYIRQDVVLSKYIFFMTRRNSYLLVQAQLKNVLALKHEKGLTI
jgi:hypothetical protein